ncbi:MAG: hypothetical protein LBR91_00110 [Puniceicoccales bacterium]|jgi:uncharacterized protein YukE|nr:hypothetical protein [Puniceicoccales bacterium]
MLFSSKTTIEDTLFSGKMIIFIYFDKIANILTIACIMPSIPSVTEVKAGGLDSVREGEAKFERHSVSDAAQGFSAVSFFRNVVSSINSLLHRCLSSFGAKKPNLNEQDKSFRSVDGANGKKNKLEDATGNASSGSLSTKAIDNFSKEVWTNIHTCSEYRNELETAEDKGITLNEKEKEAKNFIFAKLDELREMEASVQDLRAKIGNKEELLGDLRKVMDELATAEKDKKTYAKPNKKDATYMDFSGKIDELKKRKGELKKEIATVDKEIGELKKDKLSDERLAMCAKNVETVEEKAMSLGLGFYGNFSSRSC